MSTVKCTILNNNTIKPQQRKKRFLLWSKLLETTDLWKDMVSSVCLSASCLKAGKKFLLASVVCGAAPLFSYSKDEEAIYHPRGLQGRENQESRAYQVKNQNTGGHYDADMSCYLFFGSSGFCFTYPRKGYLLPQLFNLPWDIVL